jgi:hypothetical protein
MQHCEPRIAVLVGAFTLTLMVIGAGAHPPSDLNLTYDSMTGELRAVFTHRVADPATHYVKEVSITTDGGVVLERKYTSQPSTTTFSYTYPIQASAGTTITVRGECSLAGEVTRSLVASAGPVQTATITPTMAETPHTMAATQAPAATPIPTGIPVTTATKAPGFALGSSIMGLAGAGFFLCRRYRGPFQ